MANQLSPSAQAVRDAAFCAYDDKTLYFAATAEQYSGIIAAAALRAAADQMSAHHSKTFLYSIADYWKLQSIAAELESATHDEPS